MQDSIQFITANPGALDMAADMIRGMGLGQQFIAGAVIIGALLRLT